MLNLEFIHATMVTLALNQAALAAQCNVSREAVSNWLSGEATPRPSKLKALAQALGVEIASLTTSRVAQPIVAYRTKKNKEVTGPALNAAVDLAHHLRQLTPFVRGESLFSPAILEAPQSDDDYVRKVTQQIRKRIGISSTAPLTREQILELHHDFGSILVPVRWAGDKSGHENALSVYLPESKLSWVVFSLNARNDDFNYWLAHELAHCYTLHTLSGDEGETFAERFAQELLFPHDAAVEAIEEFAEHADPMARARYLADAYNISIVTVIKQVERTAHKLGRQLADLQTEAFWPDWHEKRALVPTVARALFGTQHLSVEDYVAQSEKMFKTPIFKAIASWQQQEGGRSPAFIASALNIALDEAIELSHLLMKPNAVK
jgi:transcriptional regulator with XRE-family HTH domain